jgi:serine/threonine protein phosphatase 1
MRPRYEEFGVPIMNSTCDTTATNKNTPTVEPEGLPNRINIDTDAFATGRLTCVVLEGDSRQYITT